MASKEPNLICLVAGLEDGTSHLSSSHVSYIYQLASNHHDHQVSKTSSKPNNSIQVTKAPQAGKATQVSKAPQGSKALQRSKAPQGRKTSQVTEKYLKEG